MGQVVLDHVGKRFGSLSVIEDFNLSIADREFMVLVGPSGCGKSTVLRMIAGLEELTSGSISIDGRVIDDLPPKNRDIAMVFQSYALYPHMTVRENLEFGLRMRKIPAEEIDRLVNDAARILELEPMLDRKPRDLSGGQRQRVAVGRAIVRKPSVFLFDEPLSNLDAKLRVHMRAEITRLQRRLLTTCVYVTHDQIEAMTMGHRIAVMNAGRLQQVGAPLEVYERPANLFVARFIGTPPMNILPATATDRRLLAQGFELTLPAPVGSREVMVGIRPEHLRLDSNGPIRGTVELVEPLGHEVTVYARVADNLLVSALDPQQMPRVGDSIAFTVDSARLHLFDAKTEQRLPP